MLGVESPYRLPVSWSGSCSEVMGLSELKLEVLSMPFLLPMSFSQPTVYLMPQPPLLFHDERGQDGLHGRATYQT